ncbi:MAG: polyprenyl synthetase family protein [Myxococcales bacterium]|nr:polyprenyl synthetase family protein [Myxococcales bacterium]
MSLDALRARFDAALEAHAAGWADWPPALVEACRYTLFGGGKRVRPVLALMAAEAVGGDAAAALPWAMAVEMIHTYSLVHDDLPAMDDDDERRGRPTCHVQFDEATAILAGDALLTEAFRTLGAADAPAERTARLVTLLGVAAGGGGMVGGQVEDIGGVGTLAALEQMQRRKTGALIRAAAEGGAIAAGADADTVAAVGRYGAALGLLFQITDDVLDAEQDAERDGNSYLHHLGLDGTLAKRDAVHAEARAALAPLGDGGAALAALADTIARRTV